MSNKKKKFEKGHKKKNKYAKFSKVEQEEKRLRGELTK